MRYSDNIITVIESIVAQMTPVITVTLSTDNADGTFQLDACQTYWVHKGMTITYKGNDYVVSDIDVNNSITVTAAADPGTGTFQLDAPAFWHGSHRKVENERKDLKDVKKPVVYLPVPSVRADNRYDSDIAYTADIRPIFLLNYLKRRDTTTQQQAEVIDPANEMADLFEEKCEIDGRFEDPENITRREWMNFGDETIWGNDELIFDQPLSGVELKMSLEILKSYICQCDEGDEPVTCPDVTKSFNGVATGVDTAAGQDIDFQVVTESDIPTGTLLSATANTVKVEVTTPAAAINTSNQIQTGQITAVTPGSDGDTRRGRLVDFYTLPFNNFFGNTLRFTDTSGTQVFSDGWVIDWSQWDQVSGDFLMFNNSLEDFDFATALAAEPYTKAGYADCFVPNENEIYPILNREIPAGSLNYAPFNHLINSTATRVWTATESPDASSAAYAVTNINSSITGTGKGTTCKVMWARVGNESEL